MLHMTIWPLISHTECSLNVCYSGCCIQLLVTSSCRLVACSRSLSLLKFDIDHFWFLLHSGQLYPTNFEKLAEMWHDLHVIAKTAWCPSINHSKLWRSRMNCFLYCMGSLQPSPFSEWNFRISLNNSPFLFITGEIVGCSDLHTDELVIWCW